MLWKPHLDLRLLLLLPQLAQRLLVNAASRWSLVFPWQYLWCCSLPVSVLLLPLQVMKRMPNAQAESLVPAYLWQHVYGLYGFDSEALGVDFMTFSGDALRFSSPRSAQVRSQLLMRWAVQHVMQQCCDVRLALTS